MENHSQISVQTLGVVVHLLYRSPQHSVMLMLRQLLTIHIMLEEFGSHGCCMNPFC